MLRSLVVVAALASALACSGSDPEPGMTPDARAAIDAAVRDPTMLWVAGSYPTQVMLVGSTCSGITVQDMTTQVIHQAGAGTLTVVHASVRYDGTIATDGTFQAGPRSVTVGGDTHTLSVAGRFMATGFEATVTAQVTRGGGGSCSYSVSWVGSKNGEPNVIPG